MEGNDIITNVQPVTICDQLDSRPIHSRILLLRDIPILIDRDIAELYGVETKALNQAVKRNRNRFPERYCFELTKQEKDELFTNCDRFNALKHSSAMPHAFTEQGVAMLSAVLKSETAIQVSINIMDAFVAMRHTLSNNSLIFNRLESIEHNQMLIQSEHMEIKRRQDATDKRIEEVFLEMERSTSTPSQGVFFDGQIYDAYRFVAECTRKARQRIVLIDNYIDDTVLTLLDKRADGVTAKIYTTNISRQLRLDLERHNNQYAPIEIGIYRRAHDRFLIIDEEVYHIGASIKDLGKKLFAFSLMTEWSATDFLTNIATS